MRKLFAILILSSSLALAAPSMAQAPKEEAKVVKVEAKAPASQPVAAVAKTEVAVPAKVATPTTEPIVTEWWKVLIRYGLELVFTVLGLLISVLVTVLMKKYGFEDYSAKVNDALSRGVGYAEQMSLKALKISGKPLGSAEKMDIALQFVTDKAKEYKLPDKGKEWWTKKVEGWLGVQNQENGTSTTPQA
jgi:hypothetical protein